MYVTARVRAPKNGTMTSTCSKALAASQGKINQSHSESVYHILYREMRGDLFL